MVHCRKPDENTKPFEKLFIGGPVTITPASEVLTVELLAFFTKDFANPEYIAVRVILWNYLIIKKIHTETLLCVGWGV